ncbi:response regulator transcription factor [Nocardioides aestuarii]|uniref:Response regulator n=1 Tax=Nocardioides aestuarii TaxID=252231 RepID=A0ABW4TUG2_9ACTN
MNDEPVRVLIVDDHEVLASSLAQALDIEPDLQVVGRAGSLSAAEAMITSTMPDVLLLDHRLPDGDGVGAIPRLRALRPRMAVVVLTASTAEHVLVSAIESGASGFVSKTRGLPELVSAVRAAAAGEAVVSPEMLSRLLPRLQRQRNRGNGHQALTEREREVLSLVAEGLTNAAIAERLVVSVHTVRNHVANLSAKLGASSKLEALAIAVREGLLPDS